MAVGAGLFGLAAFAVLSMMVSTAPTADPLSSWQSLLHHLFRIAVTVLAVILGGTLAAFISLVRENKNDRRATQRLLNDIGDGVVQLSQKGAILAVNRSFAEALGFSAAELIGEQFCEILYGRSDGSRSFSGAHPLKAGELFGGQTTTVVARRPNSCAGPWTSHASASAGRPVRP